MKELTDFLAVQAGPTSKTLVIVRPRHMYSDEEYERLATRIRHMRESGELPEWVTVLLIENADVFIASESEVHSGQITT